MTVEELEQQLAETQAKLDASEKTNKTLEANQSNQNSYITKLEETKSALTEQINSIKSTANSPALDPNITAYFKKKYVEDFEKDGIAEIISRDTKGVFPKVEAELRSFLKAHMTENNASLKFVLDAYSLVLGRAYADPEHEIHKVDEPTPTEGEPTEPPADKGVPSNIHEPIPPTLTDSDPASGNPVPRPQVEVRNTKEAFKVFEDRLFKQGQDKYE